MGFSDGLREGDSDDMRDGSKLGKTVGKFDFVVAG